MLPRLPNMPLKNADRWIVDSDGRTVIIRGVNMINKMPPDYTLSATGFGEVDAQLLAANGFNAVRVGVIYSAVEPTPGQYDVDYLQDIKGTVDMLAGYGIMSLIDFHQDGWGPKFKCEGFPKWATFTDGNTFGGENFPALLTDPAVMAAFGNLWRNTLVQGVGLQDRFAAAWAQAVEILKDSPGILGWEILNEPWPGNLMALKKPLDWKHLLEEIGEDIAESHIYLREFTRKVVASIRTHDSDHMIWYEPWVLFDWGIPTFIGKIDDPAGRIGFAFHNYINIDGLVPPGIPYSYDTAWKNALDHSKATGDALLATEFGADFNAQLITEQMTSIDANMMPAIYWAYWNRTPYQIVNPITGQQLSSEDMGLVYDLTAPRDQPGNVQVDRLAALTRPYPMFIAGTPVQWSFDSDPAARIFSFTYIPATSGPNVTEIFVPDLHYPKGAWTASVIAEGDVTLTPTTQALLVETNGPVPTVTVTIQPSGTP